MFVCYSFCMARILLGCAFEMGKVWEMGGVNGAVE
jgi:hypothetical protein